MRRVAALAAMLAVPGVLAQVAPPEVQARFADCAEHGLSWLACAQAIERQALPAARDVVRSPGLLTIRTPGRTVRLEDEGEATESSYPTLVHGYLGRVGPAGHHLVLRIHREHGNHLLIHALSGQSARLPTYPVVSPDGRQFVVASEDLMAGFRPNVVEVWSASASGFRRDALFKPDWGPGEAKWITPREIEVRRTCLKSTEEDPAAALPCGIARIVNAGKRWRMVE